MGVGIGYFILGSRESSVQRAEQCLENDSKLQSLSDKEYSDYLSTTDPREKLKKGDELLSKIMMLFIADLGVRLGQLKPVEFPAQEACAVPAVSNVASPSKSSGEASAPIAQVMTPSTTERPDLSVRFFVESEDTIPETVKAHEKKNLFQTIRAGTAVTPNHLRMINGLYTGEIKFHDGAEPWQVEWTANLDMRSGKPSGTHRIKFSKAGKVFSDHSSEGGEHDAFSGTPHSLLVRANGDKGYMQLFPAENLGMMVGTYYDKKAIDNFVPIGTVTLRRH